MASITSIPENDRRERFIAAGGQTEFPFDFPVYRPDHIAMYRLRAGVETALTYGADFGVLGYGDQGGGVATLTAGAEAGDIIVVKSAQPIARTTRFVDGGDLPAEGLNTEYNKVFIGFQQIRGALDRTIRVPETDPNGLLLPNAQARADAIFAFDSDGNPLMLQPDLSEYGIDKAYVQLLVTNALNRALPRTIVMPYVGSLADIPEGWELYTPMQDRFIVCAGPGRPHLSSGGSATVNTQPGGGHSHGGRTHDAALTVGQIPPHDHALDQSIYQEGTSGTGHPFLILDGYGTSDAATGTKGEGEPHYHGLDGADPHVHEVTVTPPYFALAFIARTGFFVTPPAIGDVPALTEAALATEMAFACGDETTAIAATGLKFTGRAWVTMETQEVIVTVNSACTSGTFTVNVKVNGVSMLSTLVTIDAGEEVSTTAAVPAVISAPNIAKMDKVQVEVTNVGDGTATGLKVILLGRRPSA